MKITLLRGFLFIGALLCFGMVKAQTVTGTVSDAAGPLPGASVVVKGTTNGTQTDFDGNYTLNDVAADAVIVFSYIGFEPKEHTIEKSELKTIDITLNFEASDIILMGEIAIDRLYSSKRKKPKKSNFLKYRRGVRKGEKMYSLAKKKKEKNSEKNYIWHGIKK